MDYHNQHLSPSFGGSFSSHSPQPAPQEPQSRLAQSQSQPFPYAQFANGHGPPAGFPASQQQSHLHAQARAQPSPYSTAPFAQSLASPAHPPFAQNRSTASPAASQHTSTASPYATPQQTQSPGLSASPAVNPLAVQPATSQPMAAQSPVSPVAQAREKQRIDTLLEINQVLIQQVMDLHDQGKAGHVGPAPDMKQEGEKQQQASPEYRDYMRRLQANLAFLAQNAEKHSKPNNAIMPGPAIMVAPASPDDLVKLYSRLQTLFPGWKGAPNKPSPGAAHQRLNSMSSSAGVHSGPLNLMQPPNSAGLLNNMQPPNSAGLLNNMQPPNNVGLQSNNFQ